MRLVRGVAAAALMAWAAPAGAQTVVGPADPGLLYSPYNWAVGARSATTINPGAYLRTLFGGASVAATFDVAHDAAPLSEVECRVDGVGSWTVAAVAASVSCPVPAQTASAPFHSLELVVKSTSERVNRWDAAAPGSAVVFTGLSLASGARVVAPAAAPCDVLFYGDSVMEGVRVLDIAQPLDTDRNDAVAGWAWQAGKALGCEFGLVAFGGSGLAGPGSGGVPPLAASFGQVFAGSPRAFVPAPALIVVNDGANDANVAAPAFEAVFAATLRAILAATPADSPVAVMRTFLGIQAAPTLAAVRAVGSPRVTYVDTSGFLDKALGMDDIGLHPTAANDQARVGPMSAAALRAVLLAGRDGRK
ncbi:MAG: hypothetical protein ACRYGC_11785 [Janthinobacterium lividum]